MSHEQTPGGSATPSERPIRRGTPVVGGVALGPVVRPTCEVDLSRVHLHVAASPEEESTRFTEAVASVADRLRMRAEAASGVVAEVLVAQVGLVTDKGLRKAVEKGIASGQSAEAATLSAVEQFATMFTQLGGLMAERVTDLRDLGGRLVAQLEGQPEPGVIEPDTPSILVAEDLAPADTAGLDPRRVIALVTSLGGPTSHTAIIARQLGIPCIVAADVDDLAVGARILVDGGTGEILVDPSPEQAERLIAMDRRARAAAEAWEGPGRTSDGRRVAIYANVQDGLTARTAAAAPSEGVGLFRSELAFLGRDHEPTVDEQATLYTEVLRAYGGRRVVIRTLDAGSDKPMKFASLPNEDNPALGVRGLRLATRNPALLANQLDAIALAAREAEADPWVMAPMVATTIEAAHFAAQCRERELTPGVMVEVPAAALLAHRLL